MITGDKVINKAKQRVQSNIKRKNFRRQREKKNTEKNDKAFFAPYPSSFQLKQVRNENTS